MWRIRRDVAKAASCVAFGRCIGSLFHEIFMKLLKCKVIWCIINDSSVGPGRAGDGRDAYDKKGRTVL